MTQRKAPGSRPGSDIPVIVKAALSEAAEKECVSLRLPTSLRTVLRRRRKKRSMGIWRQHHVYRAFCQHPRHIEFQIMADKHGNVIHLGERDCSIQRNHQKMIEESPSIALTPELREKMGEAAVKAAKAAHYTNAGPLSSFLRRTETSIYGNEHQDPGRTSGDRMGDRNRSGQRSRSVSRTDGL